MWLWPWVLSAVSVTGVHVAVRRPRVGWSVSLAGEGLWLVYTVQTRQWGFLLAVGVYAVAWGRHLASSAAGVEEAVADAAR
jgi:hypothetical protein